MQTTTTPPAPADPLDLGALARSLWAIAGARIAAASLACKCHDLLSQRLGARTAAWAYADNRRATGSRRDLAAWRPTLSRPIKVISGPVGCGKTVAGARWVLERGGEIVTAAEIESWSWTGGKRAAQARAHETLLVDDMGLEGSRSRGRGHLVNLVCARADAGLTTVITTNFTMDIRRLRTEYPDQLTSRVVPGWYSDTSAVVDLRSVAAEPVTTRLVGCRSISARFAALEAHFGPSSEETAPGQREEMDALILALEVDPAKVRAGAASAPPVEPVDALALALGGEDVPLRERGILIPNPRPLACSWCDVPLDRGARHPRSRKGVGGVFCSATHRDNMVRAARKEQLARTAP